jgi:hypothetical protein
MGPAPQAGIGTASNVKVYPDTPANNPEALTAHFHRSIQAGHEVASKQVASSPALSSAQPRTPAAPMSFPKC